MMCLLCGNAAVYTECTIYWHLSQANVFSNAAGSRMLTNLEPDIRYRVYCILCPEEDRMTEDTSEEEEEKEVGDA